MTGRILCLTGKIFLVTAKTFLVAAKIFLVTGKIFLLTGKIFCLTGKMFLVTGKIFCFTENGPLLHHADIIIERGMNKYWMENSANGKWHFVSRRGELGFKTSKVLQRLKKQKSKLAFMDK